MVDEILSQLECIRCYLYPETEDINGLFGHIYTTMTAADNSQAVPEH